METSHVFLVLKVCVLLLIIHGDVCGLPTGNPYLVLREMGAQSFLKELAPWMDRPKMFALLVLKKKPKPASLTPPTTPLALLLEAEQVTTGENGQFPGSREPQFSWEV